MKEKMQCFQWVLEAWQAYGMASLRLHVSCIIHLGLQSLGLKGEEHDGAVSELKGTSANSHHPGRAADHLYIVLLALSSRVLGRRALVLSVG